MLRCAKTFRATPHLPSHPGTTTGSVGTPTGAPKNVDAWEVHRGLERRRGQICGWIRIGNRVQKTLTQRFMHGTEFRSQRRCQLRGLRWATEQLQRQRCSVGSASPALQHSGRQRGGVVVAVLLQHWARRQHPLLLRRLRAADAKPPAFLMPGTCSLMPLSTRLSTSYLL